MPASTVTVMSAAAIVDHAVELGRREPDCSRHTPWAVRHGDCSRHSPCAEADGTRSVPATIATDRIDGYALISGIAHRFRHGGLVGRCDGLGQHGTLVVSHLRQGRGASIQCVPTQSVGTRLLHTSGISFPGFSLPVGSNARRTRRIASKSAGAKSRSISPIFSMPMPCSAVILPPHGDTFLQNLASGGHGALNLFPISLVEQQDADGCCRRRRGPR